MAKQMKLSDVEEASNYIISLLKTQEPTKCRDNAIKLMQEHLKLCTETRNAVWACTK